jgi:hypothetical protein
MLKQHRAKLIFLLIFLASFITYLSYSIKKDIEYRHQVFGLHPPAVNWINYDINIALDKLIKSIFSSKNPSLPKIYLYISSRSQQSLLNNIPDSTKDWKDAFLLSEDGSMNKIKMRHKGDNPFNYIFDTKSWRVKLKKDQLQNNVRVFDYSVSQSPLLITDYLPLSLARKIGILSPKARLVELYINGKFSGVYIETEKLDELFLRNNKIMPVNLYKGEVNNSGAYLSLGDDLFNNPALWTKQAIFNQRNDDDYSDLEFLFLLLAKADNNYEEFENLLRRIDISIWAKFAAFQVLVQSLHNDSNHNMRIVMDQWSGKVYPITHDIGSNIGTEKIFLDKSSNILLSTLNKNSEFVDLKLQFLNDFLNDGVLSSEVEELKNLSKVLDNSLKRSSQLIQLSATGYIAEPIRFFSSYDLTDKRDILFKKIKMFEKDLQSQLFEKPRVSWNSIKSRLRINIDGKVPIADIKLSFESNLPSKISLDSNNNNIFDENDIVIPFELNGKEIELDLRLYANRIMSAKRFSDFNSNNHNGELSEVETEFNFLFDCNCRVNQVSGSNPFSKSKYTFDYSESSAVYPSLHNKVLIQKNTNYESINFTGTNIITDSVVFNRPVKIQKGSTFKLKPGVSMIFRGKVEAIGSTDEPIIFERSNLNSAWGTIALQDNGANNSVLENIKFTGGSGGSEYGIQYTSMLSLHNVSNTVLNEIELINNSIYDDALHLVYCNNINLSNIKINQSYRDAIDIDLSSNIYLNNLIIENSGNDAIDLMDSSVIVRSSLFTNSKDKGISSGEGAIAVIYNSIIEKNNIGVAAKDSSTVILIDNELDSNNSAVSAYSKNWQYGDGGNVILYNSMIKKQLIEITKDSRIAMDDFSKNSYIENNNLNFVIYKPEDLLNNEIDRLLIAFDNEK